MEMFAELKEAVIKGDESRAYALTKGMLDQRVHPQDILNQGLLAGIEVVGQKFKVYEMYLPEVIMSATAMKSAMELLRPLLSRSDGAMLGKVVMATIQGDLHDIGKNLVSMMLLGSGFEVVDLGVDVQVSKIIQRAKEENAEIIGISALLTTNMVAMGPALKMIRKDNRAVKVMVGGAPVTQEYARQIGADGWAPDALQSIHVAKSLVKGQAWS
jgi:5-methyltetrahydrofolate--homocysteine methyltransferase